MLPLKPIVTEIINFPNYSWLYFLNVPQVCLLVLNHIYLVRFTFSFFIFWLIGDCWLSSLLPVS